jgi:hypothetical protein
MSYSACQIGPSVFYWCWEFRTLCVAAKHGPSVPFWRPSRTSGVQLVSAMTGTVAPGSADSEPRTEMDEAGEQVRECARVATNATARRCLVLCRKSWIGQSRSACRRWTTLRRQRLSQSSRARQASSRPASTSARTAARLQGARCGAAAGNSCPAPPGPGLPRSCLARRASAIEARETAAGRQGGLEVHK